MLRRLRSQPQTTGPWGSCQVQCPSRSTPHSLPVMEQQTCSSCRAQERQGAAWAGMSGAALWRQGCSAHRGRTAAVQGCRCTSTSGRQASATSTCQLHPQSCSSSSSSSNSCKDQQAHQVGALTLATLCNQLPTYSCPTHRCRLLTFSRMLAACRTAAWFPQSCTMHTLQCSSSTNSSTNSSSGALGHATKEGCTTSKGTLFACSQPPLAGTGLQHVPLTRLLSLQ
mmetsp:Transcript_19091/g.41166  ORF Transcript_19091/g.41166 Transcript_19091/m.41166 type:complete len:226 (+) Transcript_19091:147-824(+)